MKDREITENGRQLISFHNIIASYPEMLLSIFIT